MSWPKQVDKSQLRIDTYRGSGPGGQNRNKRDTAVRITHIPTGIAASNEDQNSQDLNKKRAFSKLAKKLVPLMKEALTTKVEIPESKRIRSYHEPNNRVKDVRLNGETFSYKEVIQGKGLDKIIEKLVKE